MPIPKDSSFSPRKTAKERIYLTLRQWIIDGVLEPNERLNDSELAQYFSVSRTPVREAIQLLSEQKFVHIAPSSGTYVAPIDTEDMIHVYELLAELQSIAIDLCIYRITKENLKQLNDLNETFLRCAKSEAPSDAYKADFQFHHYLALISGNPYLTEFSDQLALKAQRNENCFFSENSDLQSSYGLHKTILKALKECDSDSAKKAIRENWLSSLKRIRQ